ncbi:cap-specific mRNA (nucleoside-2'-O-)-methyltransferase 2 [Condylostylus longicornis]|uniref:cap-specific mRNA (nucleoside-2'-O-)-methyltransferase 2 n=1 Tax=Condylostylus longicornis TaxID=2530218 RepID=UPI00244E0DC8|nr:cap-specific mRNA (nucleoside-2'-O-)-methyltransferase 2 [Condylostylus longicornis]
MSYNSKEFPIDSLFEKKIRYLKQSNWILPHANDLFCTDSTNEEVDALQQLKSSLNYTKSKLNDYPIERWSKHTYHRDPASEVKSALKYMGAEFVTQAWCKFYECLEQFEIVSSSEFNSLHLCEAPGAFITALNQYLYSNFPKKQIKWNWVSTSLNPYCESNPLKKMIVDDRFIFQTLDHWTFGEDLTGDIKNQSNIEKIVADAKKIGNINLITADGSIDCVESPESQEEIVSCLHFAEICTALLTLSENGSFVIKMFTLFDMASISMMYLLNCVFRHVNIFKPVTSKCGNSEVYVICMGFDSKAPNFDGYTTLMLSKIKENMKIPSLFKKSQIPLNFLEQHEVYVRMFMQYQRSAIESNIYHFENPTRGDIKQCSNIKRNVVNAFIQRYKVKPIPKECLILFKQQPMKTEKYYSDYRGSYSDRCHLKDLSDIEKLNIFKSHFEELQNTIHFQHQFSEILRTSGTEFINLSYQFGKPIEKLNSSLFCDRALLILREKVDTVFPDLRKNSPKLLNSYCELIFDLENSFKSDSVVLHFQAGFSSSDYGLKENEFFEQIFKKIGSSTNINKIIFYDFAFLTHSSTSLLKVLWMNYFTDMSIKYDSGINIIELKTRKKSSHSEKEINHENLKSTFFCCINIKELHQNEFSSDIKSFNNAVIMKFFNTLFSTAI